MMTMPINKPSPRSLPRTQRGIALLTALLIVSMATIIAINITERQQYDIRRTENILFSQQGYYYALGGEAWARGVLYRDHKNPNNKNTDNLLEDWAQPLPVTIIEGGTLGGQISDLQGLFNLNNLYVENPGDSQANTYLQKQQAYFKRLLEILEIKAPITQAIIDWMDEDTDALFPDGAEDQIYEQKTPPYRTSNQRMRSPSELLLVEGVSIEIYEKLKPFITTLPETTLININTAPGEIIAALSSQLNLQEASEIVEDRSSVFDTIKDFIDETKGRANDKNKYELEIKDLIGVSSQYFQVQAEVLIDKVSNRLTSNLKRNADSSVETISRSPGVD